MPDLCAAFKPGQKGHSCNNTNLLYSHSNKVSNHSIYLYL
jgi:hypothetical protein